MIASLVKALLGWERKTEREKYLVAYRASCRMGRAVSLLPIPLRLREIGIGGYREWLGGRSPEPTPGMGRAGILDEVDLDERPKIFAGQVMLTAFEWNLIVPRRDGNTEASTFVYVSNRDATEVAAAV